MPRTALVIQNNPSNAGAQCANAGADQANGNSFANSGRVRLVIQNGDASPRTATFNGVACSHGRSTNLAVVIAASAQGFVGPLDPSIFNQSDGTVQLDWSAGTTAAVKVTAVDHSGV